MSARFRLHEGQMRHILVSAALRRSLSNKMLARMYGCSTDTIQRVIDRGLDGIPDSVARTEDGMRPGDEVVVTGGRYEGERGVVKSFHKPGVLRVMLGTAGDAYKTSDIVVKNLKRA